MEEKMRQISQKLIAIFTLIALLFTLTAYKKTITYTFEASGGTAIENMQSSNGVTTSFDATKKGYQLVGWYDHDDLIGDALTFPYKVKNNVTLCTKWQAIDYQIQYVMLDGILSANAPTSYNIENYPSLPTATKEGYILQGWIFENVLITELPTTLYKDITLVANWVKEDTAFMVQFVTYEGITVAPMHASCIQTAPQISLSEDESLGWYFEPAFDTLGTFLYIVSAGVTLYAKWTPKLGISEDEICELISYLQKAYTNYHWIFQQKISNENGLVFQGVNSYYVDGNTIYFIYSGMDAEGNYLKDEQGNYIYFREYVFFDESENTCHYYYEFSEGKWYVKDEIVNEIVEKNTG